MKRQTVSLCLIARDEEARIGTALKSVLALVDEVIVVDTGSRDNTRIIAEGYGSRVVDLPWGDDFAAARNAALAEAASDWVLVLDADEYLQPVRPVEFQRLLHDPTAAGYRLRIVSPREETGPEGRSQVRLFRNDPQVRYEFPIHEQVAPSLEGWARGQGLHVYDTLLAVVHEGNDADRRTRSRERALRILRKAVETHPGEAYFPYRLGCEGLVRLDDEVLPVAGLDEALVHLHTAWCRLDRLPDEQVRGLTWVPDLGARIVSALLALERNAEAVRVAGQVRDVFPDHPAVLLQAAAACIRDLQRNHGHLAPGEVRSRLEVVRADLHRLQAGAATVSFAGVDRRVRDLYPLRYLGELALLEGRVGEAVGHFEQALELDPAYSYAWLGMAECSRFAGDRKRAMKLYLRTVTESEWNHRAWFRGCDLMEEMGFHDNAASWRRSVVERFPEHPQARAERAADLAAGRGVPESVAT